MNRVSVLVAGLSLSVLASSAPASAQAPSLTGSWRITEITTTGPGAETNRSPQPGMFLFTAKHYSILRVTSAQPRPTYKDNASITPAEALASWGPLQAQIGTYEAAGGKLTTHIVVAKNPSFMNGRTSDVYSYRIEGSVLTLTEISNSSGPVRNPATIRLVRAE